MKEIRIIDFIPFGQENARTASEIARVTGLTEREVRRKISKARPDTIILNFQDRNGYFQPTNDEEYLIEHWYMQENHRNIEHRETLKAAQNYLYLKGIQ